MGRTPLRTATLVFGITMFATVSAWAAPPMTFEIGTYVLGNHPDGNKAPPPYGMRIDNLFGGVSPFTFDFECAGCLMIMEYDGSTIDISGTAYAGHPADDSDGHDDDLYDGFYAIDVTYEMAEVVENFEGEDGAGDDDGLQDIGHVGDTGDQIGTLQFLSPTTLGEAIPPVTMWDLMDKSGSHFFSIRLGDGDDDDGHRGVDGISGWGWLKFRPTPPTTLDGADEPPFVDARGAQDFIFTAERVTLPAPTSVSLLLLGLGVLYRRRRR